MSLDDIRIPSLVDEYYNEHWNIMEFCRRGNDVITISYQSGSCQQMSIKFQPDSHAAKCIRDIVRDAVEEQMADYRKMDVDYLVEQSGRMAKRLSKAIERVNHYEKIHG